MWVFCGNMLKNNSALLVVQVQLLNLFQRCNCLFSVHCQWAYMSINVMVPLWKVFWSDTGTDDLLRKVRYTTMSFVFVLFCFFILVLLYNFSYKIASLPLPPPKKKILWASKLYMLNTALLNMLFRKGIPWSRFESRWIIPLSTF